MNDLRDHTEDGFWILIVMLLGSIMFILGAVAYGIYLLL